MNFQEKSLPWRCGTGRGTGAGCAELGCPPAPWQSWIPKGTFMPGDLPIGRLKTWHLQTWVPRDAPAQAIITHPRLGSEEATARKKGEKKAK